MSTRVDWDCIDLEKLYWEQGLGQYTIAKMHGVSTSAVRSAMKCRGIPTRTSVEANVRLRKVKVPKEEVERLYWSEGLSIEQMARKLNIGSTSVTRLFSRYNIPTRPPRRVKELITKTQLEDMYINQKLAIREIAEAIQVEGRSISSLLRHYDIPIRSNSETLKIHYENYPPVRGVEHSRFKGKSRLVGSGYMEVYYPEHPRANSGGYVLEHILVWEQTHGKPLPSGWSIHHLNGIKTDNRPRNLLALQSKRHSNLIAEYQKRIQELEAQLNHQKQLL